MCLNSEQINEYKQRGAFLVKELLTTTEVATINKEIENLDKSVIGPGFSFDNDDLLRSFFNPEEYSDSVNALVKSETVQNCVRPLLDEPYYLYQSKYNTKRALKSGTWKWHSDYWFWKNGDRMPNANALTMAIFLDDVQIASGPILFIPGSQVYMEDPSIDREGMDHAENLKYYLNAEDLKKTIEEYGQVEMATGKQGDAFLFHCNLLHGSNQNMYFQDRRILMLTFNPVSNNTGDFRSSRNDYMVKSDFTAIG